MDFGGMASSELKMARWVSGELWLVNQVTYDLWHAKQHIDRLKVTKFWTLEPS